MKTISEAEYKALLSTLKQYHDYLTKNPDTLITRYFGLHKIELTSQTLEKKTFYFVMMKNIFNTNKNLKLKYDLKGSTLGRKTEINKDGSKY